LFKAYMNSSVNFKSRRILELSSTKFAAKKISLRKFQPE
jgi:hypothetical protein